MTSFASTKEETNYFRLCGLLVKVGTQVLREVLDRIHPPGRLPSVLSNQRASLSLLRKGKRPILNSTQWEKLYPQNPSTLSSENFDISLLVVLLRTICGSSLSAGDFERFPPAADKSTKADIARLKYFRNMVYGHSNQASLSNETFNTYWQDISRVLMRLEGAKHKTFIRRLRSEMIDTEAGRRYHELLKQWVQDEVNMTEKLKQIEGTVLKFVYVALVHFSLVNATVQCDTLAMICNSLGNRQCRKRTVKDLIHNPYFQNLLVYLAP